MSVDDLQKRFDELCALIGPAQHKLNMTYGDWQDALREWRELSREREEVWGKMMDSITNPLPKAQKTL